MTRDQIVALCRRKALEERASVPHRDYLPDAESVDNWYPHNWVVEAIIEAVTGPPKTTPQRTRLQHPETCVCGGEGWLWGHELKNPPEQITDTRYRCDRAPEDIDYDC